MNSLGGSSSGGSSTGGNPSGGDPSGVSPGGKSPEAGPSQPKKSRSTKGKGKGREYYERWRDNDKLMRQVDPEYDKEVTDKRREKNKVFFDKGKKRRAEDPELDATFKADSKMRKEIFTEKQSQKRVEDPDFDKECAAKIKDYSTKAYDKLKERKKDPKFKEEYLAKERARAAEEKKIWENNNAGIDLTEDPCYDHPTLWRYKDKKGRVIEERDLDLDTETIKVSHLYKKSNKVKVWEKWTEDFSGNRLDS